MTTITVAKGELTKGAANGRPVAFSQAVWGWYYTDTPKADAIQMVAGQVRVVAK